MRAVDYAVMYRELCIELYSDLEAFSEVHIAVQ